MITRIGKATTRFIPTTLVALCAACGGGDTASTTPLTNTPGVINNDDITTPGIQGARELLVSDPTTSTRTITQCVCDKRFRSTLKIYHFENQNAVLLIEFDNQSADFTSTAHLHLFDQFASADAVAKWINNQHSDGLYVTGATPASTHSVPANAITVTSAVAVELYSGESGDEYQETQLEFTIDNLSIPDVYFLNGFADQSIVYLQTR